MYTVTTAGETPWQVAKDRTKRRGGCPIGIVRFDPDRHHRHSIRLEGYDYSQPGAYFVTVCTRERECLLGEVVNGKMRLNPLGKMAAACWHAIPHHFPPSGVG